MIFVRYLLNSIFGLFLENSMDTLVSAIILGYQMVNGKEEKCIMLGTVSNKDDTTLDDLEESKIKQTTVVKIEQPIPENIPKKVFCRKKE